MYKFNKSIFLPVVLLLLGCTASKSTVIEEPFLEMMDIPSYRVEDVSGSITLPVVDLIVDYQSGEIGYIAVKAPLSGFDLDIRTAPYQSNQIILIPGRLADLDVEGERFKLQVGVQELASAPSFGPTVEELPGDWREAVDLYWKSFNGPEE